jgi:hypothetical protein
MATLKRCFKNCSSRVDRRWGDIPHPLADVPLDVAWEHLPQGAAREGSLPEATVTFVLSVAAKPRRSPAEVVVDHVCNEDVATAQPLGEEAALGDLGLALAVDLQREALSADPLAVLAPVLVVVSTCRLAHSPFYRDRRGSYAPCRWWRSGRCA